MTSAWREQSRAAEASAPHRKSLRLRTGLWLAVVLVFVVQVALMSLLGNPPAAMPLHLPTAPIVYVGTNQWDDWLALQDPTLFMLPHSNNFSGPAWLKVPQRTFEPTNWSEPARPLQLPREQLGGVFVAFMETNSPPRLQTDIRSESDLIDLRDPDSTPMHPISVGSTVRVEGGLAGRRLLSPIKLPPQTNSDFDVLPDTEVQLLVDAEGNAFSPVIISSIKNEAADAAALNFAKNARFEPIKTPALGTVLPDTMTVGKLIFEWQTMPPAPTNAPPSNP